MFGFGRLKCRVAGIFPCLRARTALMRDATPDARFICPMLLFTDPIPQYLFRPEL